MRLCSHYTVTDNDDFAEADSQPGDGTDREADVETAVGMNHQHADHAAIRALPPNPIDVDGHQLLCRECGALRQVYFFQNDAATHSS